ncbi:MAG: bifunctional pyr operon transcriptional regulator/uracil phosphoribosyltransferase [Bermanella sp.]|nr:bifunctional pyr operon transcriptional regulator/uracil phosphoribosyltransferase [Bermanella sp.]|tara:strand:- start:2331 stop:2825 length:495 start_codon:yes stop_codon:yes gene_type:complete
MSLPQPDQLIANMAKALMPLTQQDNVVMIGIHTGGAWVAKQLHEQLGLNSALGLLDISFYRDDFSQNGLHPKVKGSELPDIENKTIILVDDVIMSGRTIRAAMNELFDYGRPEKIVLACLLDVGHRELPIQADVIGEKIERPRNQRIKLSGPTPLTLTTVNLEK